MYARMLETRNLHDLALRLQHLQADLRLDLKAIAINVNAVEAAPPKSVIAIAQIAEARLIEQIDDAAQEEIATATQKGDITTAATAEKTRSLGVIVARHQCGDESRDLAGICRAIGVEHEDDITLARGKART